MIQGQAKIGVPAAADPEPLRGGLEDKSALVAAFTSKHEKRGTLMPTGGHCRTRERSYARTANRSFDGNFLTIESEGTARATAHSPPRGHGAYEMNSIRLPSGSRK